jgi:hypothetical protein
MVLTLIDDFLDNLRLQTPWETKVQLGTQIGAQ